MPLKYLVDYPAFNECYHFIGATKYRKNLFTDEGKRTYLKSLIEEIIQKKDKVELIEMTVAYNHIHVLIRTELTPAQVGQTIFGASSRYMRNKYSELVDEAKTGLWGGKSVKAIRDESHLNRCISYIQRHRPDNTKIDEE